jgi:hypothetical protein
VLRVVFLQVMSACIGWFGLQRNLCFPNRYFLCSLCEFATEDFVDRFLAGAILMLRRVLATLEYDWILLISYTVYLKADYLPLF